jgi:hypothetical protein
MKIALLLALLAPLSAFAFQSGGVTLRCDDASMDPGGIYVSYGYEWTNGGDSTQVLDVSSWATDSQHFTVQTYVPQDSKAFPKGVTGVVSLEAPSYSKDNIVNISIHTDTADFVMTVRRQDIHRDSYVNMGDDANFRATYSFPATATYKEIEPSGFTNVKTSKLKCRASSGEHGMA